MGTFRAIVTVILMIAFIALVVWLFVFRKRSDFEEAARIPLEDDKNKENPNE